MMLYTIKISHFTVGLRLVLLLTEVFRLILF